MMVFSQYREEEDHFVPENLRTVPIILRDFANNATPAEIVETAEQVIAEKKFFVSCFRLLSVLIFLRSRQIMLKIRCFFFENCLVVQERQTIG